jgi:hypothetical protein
MARLALPLIVLALLPGIAGATDWGLFPDFRHTSGLPGNGFGVNERAQVGFEGAFHMNVPCAYTPAAGNVWAAYYSASRDSQIRFGSGGADTDSTGAIFVGLGKPGHGLCVSEVFVESDLSVNCTNLQWQIHDETPDVPAIAIGVLDVGDQRQSAFGFRHGARSFYATATRRVTDSSRPVYVSLGFGNHRFQNRPFGAINWQPSKAVNLGVEYDCFVARPFAHFKLFESDEWMGVAGLAWSNFDRPVVGLSIGRRR